ncbi:ABC transporter permease [Ornithinimicrobium pekingense]|uniref:ABC transporter n=1 Tax=Ornithinimicrobium pekingense TaxID=384677 RepID=A0ABQ2FB15_9MICO|nr:ABC transporter permease [Ornithinimicrobium pekingense]GGK74717.1 ABC transporter [Ornithinimicrobium pekingense]
MSDPAARAGVEGAADDEATGRTAPAAPATGRAAPARTRVLAQARFEAVGLLSHGEQLLVSIVLPLLALVALALVDYPELAVGPWDGARRIDVLTPGVLALAVMSTAFTGQAILLGFERRWGVLRLLGTTPLGRGGLLAAKALSVLAVLAVQLVVIGAVAALLGWRPDPFGLVVALVTVVLGATVFALLAACLGGTLRAEAVLALANLVWVLLAAGGGVLLPARVLPEPLALLVGLLPSAALGDGLRTALVDGGVDLRAFLVLLLWGVLAAVVARRYLRWSD